jgi:nuclear transport factor 2 (NTF2) superfamily protein
MDRPPLPPFTLETAIQKVRMAEDAWNSRDRTSVPLAYTFHWPGGRSPDDHPSLSELGV